MADQGSVRLTYRSVLVLEDLTGNDASKVGPAVDTEDDTAGALPWRVPREPDGDQGTTDKDTGHADVSEAVAQLVAVACGHDNAANDTETHAEDGVQGALFEVVTRVNDNEETDGATESVSR